MLLVTLLFGRYFNSKASSLRIIYIHRFVFCLYNGSEKKMQDSFGQNPRFGAVSMGGNPSERCGGSARRACGRTWRATRPLRSSRKLGR